MTAKEKADELLEKFEPYADYQECDVFTERENMLKNAKQCALIAVDEIIDLINEIVYFREWDNSMNYWNDVKQEIESYE